MIFGMLLVDLALHTSYRRFLSSQTKLCTYLSIPLILLGWYLISYPDAQPEWSPWSLSLYKLAPYLFPSEVPNISKRYTALGVDLVAFGIQACHPAKSVLSNTFFLWLGRNSFAVYLIHGTLLRTVLAWMLYGITGKPFDPTPVNTLHHDDGTEEIQPEWLHRKAHGLLFFLVIGVWLCVVYLCAQIWTTHVDAWCGRVTKRLEDHVFVADGEKEDDGEGFSEKVNAPVTGPLLG